MTPSETETLKMFDEKFAEHKNGKNSIGLQYIDAPESVFKDFLLSQIRLARADERKRAYEDGKNAAVDYIKSKISFYENYAGYPPPPVGDPQERYLIDSEDIESARKA